MEEMLRAIGRLFLSVTVFAALVVPTACDPDPRLAGDSAACKTPVPAKETVCGLLLALSVIVNVPVLLPVAVGVKDTLIVQLPPAASEDPQVVVSE
jgi:hypothetical protein